MTKILDTSSRAGMSFQEKCTWALTGSIVMVFGWYFTLVVGEIADSPGRGYAYRGLMVPVVILLVLLAAVTHAAIALAAPAEAGVEDERDRLIQLRGQRVGGYVLAAGTVGGLALAVLDADTFWIAQGRGRRPRRGAADGFADCVRDLSLRRWTEGATDAASKAGVNRTRALLVNGAELAEPTLAAQRDAIAAAS